jgi:hypothetical protein
MAANQDVALITTGVHHHITQLIGLVEEELRISKGGAPFPA